MRWRDRGISWQSEENKRLRCKCVCSNKHIQKRPLDCCAPTTGGDTDPQYLCNLLRLDIELATTKRLKKKHKKTKAKVFLSMLQTGELFGEEDSKNILEDYVTSSAHEIFCAWKIQKAIDTGASGGLNYGAIKSLHKVVEELGRYERGILPASSVIQAEAAALEETANNETTGKLPYEKWESKNGEWNNAALNRHQGTRWTISGADVQVYQHLQNRRVTLVTEETDNGAPVLVTAIPGVENLNECWSNSQDDLYKLEAAEVMEKCLLWNYQNALESWRWLV
eukprot:scaffold28784_cov53-Attheya_sp.AAC.5